MSNFKLMHVKIIINHTLLNNNYKSVDPNICKQPVFSLKYAVISFAAGNFAGMISFDKDDLPNSNTYSIS